MKTKTPLIVVILAIAVFAGLFAWGYKNRENSATKVQGARTENNSVLTPAETVYDFGKISMKDGNFEKDFVVTNNSEQDVTITALYTSCMCTSAFIVKPDGSTDGPYGMEGMSHNQVSGLAIKPGESYKIRAVYDPNAHGPAGVGAIDRLVFLRDSNGGFLQFEIKAVVTP